MIANRAKSMVLLWTSVLLLFFLLPWDGGVRDASASEASFDLTFRDNLLNAKIETVSLKEVLERLSRLTNIEISLEKSVGDETVTVEFKNLPLEEGILRILQGKSYALTYDQNPFLKGRRVLPKVVGIRVVPEGAGSSMDKERADSVILLPGSSEGGRPPETLEGQIGNTLFPQDSDKGLGLRDQDPKVREAELERLGQGDQPIPVDSLAEMVLTDKSPQLRMDAMSLLAEKGGDAALDTLTQAIRDPDPGVSGLAMGLLEERKILAEVLLEKLKEDSH